MATLAEFFLQDSRYYGLVYGAATILMLEMSLFLLCDAGPVDWKVCTTVGILMAGVTVYGLEKLSDDCWLLVEGLLFITLGIGFLSKWHNSKEPLVLFVIGVLTWGMGVFDFLYLLQPAVREANGWFPSWMCTIAFIVIGWHKMAHATE